MSYTTVTLLALSLLGDFGVPWCPWLPHSLFCPAQTACSAVVGIYTFASTILFVSYIFEWRFMIYIIDFIFCYIFWMDCLLNLSRIVVVTFVGQLWRTCCGCRNRSILLVISYICCATEYNEAEIISHSFMMILFMIIFLHVKALFKR